MNIHDFCVESLRIALEQQSNVISQANPLNKEYWRGAGQAYERIIKEIESYVSKEKTIKVKLKEWKKRPEHWNSLGHMDYLNGQQAIVEQTGKYSFNVFDKTGSSRNGFWEIIESDIDVIYMSGEKNG